MFLSLMESRPAIAIPLLSAMTHRLRRTDELLRHRVARNANVEQDRRATVADRSADLIASFGGSWKFIIVAVCLIIIWVIGNSWLLHQKVFDPFPYILLNLVLNVLCALQAPLIMMSQNRQAEKDRIRADLDYRVNLNNELMLSEIRRRVDALQEHLSRIADGHSSANIVLFGEEMESCWEPRFNRLIVGIHPNRQVLQSRVCTRCPFVAQTSSLLYRGFPIRNAR